MLILLFEFFAYADFLNFALELWAYIKSQNYHIK